MEVGPGDLPPIAAVLSHKPFIAKRQFMKNYRFPDGLESFRIASVASLHTPRHGIVLQAGAFPVNLCIARL
jgi:hypothetical protein